MSLLKSKYFLFLALLAAVLFVSISLGGEYLHDRIHHHVTQEEHDDCPVFQLINQLCIFVAAFLVIFASVSFLNVVVFCTPLVSNLSFNLPNLRAPPIFF